MGTKIKRFFKKIRIKRTTVLVLVFVFMSATLVRQLFELQIIQGEAYISKFESRTTKKRVIKSTRGNIYDRNGEELATNVLAYSVTFEDNGTYDSWYWAHPPVYMPLNCNLPEVEHIKQFVDIPVICAGRMQAETAAQAIAEGRLDAVAIGRQFICDGEYLT